MSRVTLPLLALSLLAVSSCSSTRLTLINDTSDAVRLSGCGIDDALDLDAGGKSQQEFSPAGRTGCNVYVGGTYRGCLVVQSKAGTYHLLRDVNPNVTEADCERVG